MVLGLASFAQLGVDIFPKVDLPTITITTRLPGAAPEEIESQITKAIEEAVNTIAGLDELRSSSIEGQSQVFATFVLERNVQEAANDVREKVNAIVSRFPPGTEAPIIEKADPDSAPVMAVVISGQRAPREITEIADKRIKRQLETVKDVGAITIVGGQKREIQVFVDPDRLSGYGLSIQQVKDALARQNVEIPGGRITGGAQEEGLRTLGRIETPEGFEELIVADLKGGPVRVRDIATVVDGEEEPRTLSRLNGRNAVSLVIRKQSGTNTVAVVDRIKGRLAEIQKGLPQDIQFEVVRDLSRFIKRSIHEVQDHLLLGGLLASLIVAVFIGNLVWWEMAAVALIVGTVGAAFLTGDPELLLQVTAVCIVITMIFFGAVRKLRPAFVAALAIPCSIVATFLAMRMAGFTLNNLTMLGLSLSTGIVIDDAIIVLENIFRHVDEERRSPVRGGHHRHQGDRPRRDGHHAFPGRHLSSRGLHGRAGGQVLELLRAHRDLRHHGVAARRLHPHPHAGRPHLRRPRAGPGAEAAATATRAAACIAASSEPTRACSAGASATGGWSSRSASPSWSRAGFS